MHTPFEYIKNVNNALITLNIFISFISALIAILIILKNNSIFMLASESSYLNSIIYYLKILLYRKMFLNNCTVEYIFVHPIIITWEYRIMHAHGYLIPRVKR